MKKHLANAITASRFVFTGLMLWSEPFSTLFWVWYLCGGISDIIDGPVARMLHQQSAFGAKFDSAADFVFFVSIGVIAILNVVFPVWALIFMCGVAATHFTSYGISYRKFRAIVALHTWLNKAAGVMLYAFPVLYFVLGMDAACGTICFIALVAAVEELVLIIRSKELDRDRKSLFHVGKSS